MHDGDGILAALAVLLIVVVLGGLVGSLINSDVQDTRRMELCIQAGKDWDGDHGDCIDK